MTTEELIKELDTVNIEELIEELDRACNIEELIAELETPKGDIDR